jgi:hypothetical protein
VGAGADLGPWQLGPWPGARRRYSGLSMHCSRTMRCNVGIVTEGGPGPSEFLDPPLSGSEERVGRATSDMSSGVSVFMCGHPS